MTYDDLLAGLESLATQEARPTAHEVAVYVALFYCVPGNGAGGSCHIVLDDDNIDDGSVSYCLHSALAKGDRLGAAMAQVLLRLSRSQRDFVATLGPYSYDPHANRWDSVIPSRSEWRRRNHARRNGLPWPPPARTPREHESSESDA